MGDSDNSSSDDNLAMRTRRLSFSTDDTVDKCIRKMEKGEMTADDFKQSWKKTVPKVYVLEKYRNYPEVQCSDMEPVLISTIEQFIAGGDEMLEKLNEMDSPPSMCGRVFKLGEPTYFCRECGKDLTCVLCAECFKHSIHRHHKYKMGTSHGGGCCDCGDIEAWKSDPFCDIHAKGAENKTESKGFPEDVAERARVAFEAILTYTFDLLTVKHTMDLPAYLRDNNFEISSNDYFCLVMFNDETHSFEQVLSAMAKVMKSPQRDVIEIVNKVDREGRAIIKSDEFQVCNDLRDQLFSCMSRQNQQPIRAGVFHVDVIAHQTFALKLLSWLHKVVSRSEGLRAVLNSVVLGTGLYPNTTLVEQLLTEDVNLWKAARVAWHRLLMASLLMDYDSKKALAKYFAKKYAVVMKDFIRDDHDHSMSIVSLSVQLFTVPTLAQYLIAKERVLFVLWNTFMSECMPKLNFEGKLVFERSLPNSAFRRALYILGDIKLLLCGTPTWTDDLRKGYMQGFHHMMKLMKAMQNMDCVKREVAQHVEYEPEWEPVFLLHMRVASIVSLIIEWSASDESVLLQSCRMLVNKLSEASLLFPEEPERGVFSVAGHKASCIVYDVSEESVSMHLPMCRLFAGLYLHLEKYNKTIDDIRQSPTTITVEEIIEHAMRLQVLIAQVHAGMWRRNGYALVTQIGLYNGPKCRSEMLDRDIVLLQIGAHLLDSNQFLIQLLNKFNLLNWCQEQFELTADEDRLRRTIYLVEEFLGLLITIIGERFVPGVGQVTEDDEIKKDIIQQLCIKPMSHSELCTSFRDEIARENRVEAVIKEVADFKKPASGKGVYEIKREFHNAYNIFFYHYTREERSKSEENQRKRRKAAGELECCPPPKLPPLSKAFSCVAHLLDCDVMMHILRTVLERSGNLRAQSFSETQLHKALHLIGYGLQEEESNPKITFTQEADKVKMEALLEELVKSPRVEALKDLLRWTLMKYQQVKARKAEEPVTASASELALQADKEKERRAKMAAEKRAKIMAQMTAMQKSFMKENAKLFSAETDKSKESSESAMEVANTEEGSPVALGEKQTPCVMNSEVYTCILCQEDEAINMKGTHVLVLAAYVQRSSVLNQCRQSEQDFNPLFLNSSLGLELHTSTCGHMMHLACWRHYFDNLAFKATRQHRIRQPPSYDLEKKEFLCPLCNCLSNAVLPLVPTPQAYLPEEPPVYLETFSQWLRTNQETDRSSWLDIVWKVGQPDSGSGAPETTAQSQSEPSSSSSTSLFSSVAGTSNQARQDGLGRSTDNSAIARLLDMRESLSGQIPMSPPLKETITTFARRGLHKMDAYIKITDDNVVPYLKSRPIALDDRLVPYMAWKSCAYTIHSQEWLLRDAGKSLLGHMSSRQHDCLQALTRVMPLLGDSAPSLFPIMSLLMDNYHRAPCILEWDSFGLLVSLTFSHSKRGVPTGKGCEQHVVRLALIVEIIRVLLTSYLRSNDEEGHLMDIEEEEVPEEPKEDTEPLLRLLQALRDSCGVTDVPLPDGHILWTQVKDACQPFLRCTVLFFHFLLSIPAPSSLCDPLGDTFSNLLSYLGLPSLCIDLLSEPEIIQLARYWASRPAVHLLLKSPATLIKPPTHINRLVPLPEDYSDFMNAVSTFQCPRSQQTAESRNPTMCLVCGEMLCSQNYCCQVEIDRNNMGACMYHTRNCGAGVGVFLRVRECEVLLLSSLRKGCFMASPYVDDYGETDQGLHRGNRLKLSRPLYRELELLWLSHSIREQISRTLDRGTNQMIAQWNYL